MTDGAAVIPVAPAESLRSTDQLFSNRFDVRVKSIMTVLIALHVPLVLINGTIDGYLVATIAHLAMAAMALCMVRLSKDAIRTFIFSHVYWTFSFMTFAYAASNGQTASHGLGNPDGSALIALTSQCGLFAAFFLSARRPIFPVKPALQDRAALRFLDLERTQPFLFAAGIAGVVCDLFDLLPDVYTAALTPFLFLGLGIRVVSRRSRGKALFDGPIILSLLAAFVLSAANNARTDILSSVLFLSFLIIMAAPRLFTVWNAVLAYFAARALAVISAVTLSVRWARQTAVDIASLFFEGLFSTESLVTILNPFHVHAAEVAYSASLGVQRGYSEFFGAGSSLLGRLTVLPFMDVATSRMGDVSQIQWGGFWNMILSALPALGQEKRSLIFSDNLAWDLGLRMRGSIGRPMMTAEGELYSIGGHVLVLLVIPLCFLALHWAYRTIARMTGSRAVSILICSQFFINTIFTTTALGTIIGTTRDPLQLMVVVALTLWIARLRLAPTSQRHRGAMVER